MAREMAANGPLALVAVRGTMVRGLADAVAARWTVNWPSRRSCARPPIMPKGRRCV
jgi:hypothetical protein